MRAHATLLSSAEKNASRNVIIVLAFLRVGLTESFLQIFAFRCSKFNDTDIEDGRVPDRPPRALKPVFSEHKS